MEIKECVEVDKLIEAIDNKIKYIKEHYIETPDIQNATGATFNYHCGRLDMLENMKKFIRGEDNDL